MQGLPACLPPNSNPCQILNPERKPRPRADIVCADLQVEGTLVAAGTLGLLRLCQRLLPCKPEAAELLLRGLQLVPSVDPEVCAGGLFVGQGFGGGCWVCVGGAAAGAQH